MMGTDRVDIEFAKKNNNGYCFNVGHFLDIMIEKNIDVQINKSLVNIVKKINKLKKNPTIQGDTTYFSNMADWNPEMIGANLKH